MSRTVAIVQARMGSSRLPGKVLRPLLGEPMLTRVMHRVGRSATLDAVVLATTTQPDDDVIVALAAAEGWAIERGSETDLLERYLAAARAHAADVVVRVTSDCPLIDPAVIDATVEGFRTAEVDYASNTLPPRTFPRGLDVEVIAMDALETAGGEDRDAGWREHVTPYLYHHPERFRLLRVPAEDDQSAHRWSVDTLEDLELVERIYGALGGDDFGWRKALAVVEANPSWAAVNRDVVQKSVPPAGSGG